MKTVEAEPRPAPRIELATEDGLTLKQLIPFEAVAIHALIQSNPDHSNAHHRHLAERFPTPEVLQASIEQSDPNRFQFGVWKDPTLMGSVDIKTDESAELPTAEIDYWIAKKYEGQGYITQASRKLILYGFNNMVMARLVIKTPIGNEPKNRLAQELGFRLAAVDWEIDLWNDELIKTKVYEKFKNKPSASPPVKVS